MLSLSVKGKSGASPVFHIALPAIDIFQLPKQEKSNIKKHIEPDFMEVIMKFTSSVQDDILVIEFSGMLIEKEIGDILEQYIKTVRGSGLKKVLVDTRGLVGRLSIIEVYLHTRSLPIPDQSIKTAVVEQEENKRYAEFQDLFLKNKGHRSTQFFFDPDEALAWLKE